MNFPEAIGSGFRNFINFNGRASRSEFWFWTLFSVIATGGLGNSGSFWLMTDPVGAGNGFLATVFSIIAAVLFLPSLAVAVRRLHDTGKSPLFLLWALVPVVGWFVLLGAMVGKSQRGANQFGPNPLGIYDVNDYQSQMYLPASVQQGQLPAPSAFPGYGFNFANQPEAEPVLVNREADNWARQFNQVHQQAAREVPSEYRRHYFTEEELRALRAGRSQAVLLEDSSGDFYLAEVTWTGSGFTESRLDIPGGY